MPQTAPADTASAPTPSPYVSLEAEASPNYDGEGGSSTQLNWAGQLPYGDGYLLRLKYPVITSAPTQAVTGAGDLAIYDFKIINGARGQWLAGITVRLPTAEDSSLGTGKYSVGPALAYQVRSKGWTIGFFTQDYFSVIGPASRAPVGRTKIDPILSYALPADWSVGFSSMSITYDWVSNKWIEVPVGLRIGKQFGSTRLTQPLRPLLATFEAEQNLSKVRDAPGWTTRLTLRWTL